LVKKVTEHNKWLNNIPVSNPFSVLTELDDEPTGSNIKAIEGYRETVTKTSISIHRSSSHRTPYETNEKNSQ
jgi:hypothetical protein